jgi:hypothetical protein
VRKEMKEIKKGSDSFPELSWRYILFSLIILSDDSIRKNQLSFSVLIDNNSHYRIEIIIE